MAYPRPASVSSPIDRLAQIKPKPLSLAELPPRRLLTELPPRAIPAAFPIERRDVATRERLVRRIRAEFEEMPGVCLTLLQARRLFGLPEEACGRILSGLAREGLLRRKADGSYGRSDVRP